MKILRIILGIVVILLSGYGLISGNIGTVLPLMLLSAGLLFAVIGITEFQKRKADAFNLFLVSGFVLFVGIYILV
ncbi:DUF3953 domain-containing protein [Sporosarcina aquimarina]|uniref:DUF3953 domain-containing protein n=1 Tax=Sporosarcina aquimarina TaxID=114975 RepID=A0ABU4G3H3_9BACL|nr:DUF3953 domain-containing protein [Sporosarcina aquimarina]MDW0111515.1 DUF3953 domain-containing protein [Sporosarcina aquimarina]